LHGLWASLEASINSDRTLPDRFLMIALMNDEFNASVGEGRFGQLKQITEITLRKSFSYTCYLVFEYKCKKYEEGEFVD